MATRTTTEMMQQEDNFIEQLRLRQVLGRSNEDLEKIGQALRSGQLKDVKRILRKHSREIQVVLLAEACELHDRERLNYLTQKNLDRYEAKERHVSTDVQVTEEIRIIMQELEDAPTDELLGRAREITLRRRETRPLRAITD